MTGPDHPATDQEKPAVRKIISFTHTTLDGYIDDPHKWSFQYANDELQDYGLEMTRQQRGHE